MICLYFYSHVTVLGSLDKDADGLLSVNINMNYFTDSAALQQVNSAADCQIILYLVPLCQHILHYSGRGKSKLQKRCGQ